MNSHVFSPDHPTDHELQITPGAPIAEVAKRISANVSEEALQRGAAFANEITQRFISDFEKPGDKMAHVSTFLTVGDTVYITY